MPQPAAAERRTKVLCEFLGRLTIPAPHALSTLLCQELWPVRTLRALLPEWRWWSLCVPCAAARTRAEHFHPASSQVLPVWRTQPYGEVRLIHLYPSPTSHVETDNPCYPLNRDCLAAPGTTVADSGAPVGNPNKNKTCYKCQREGHVNTWSFRDIPIRTDRLFRSLAIVRRTLTMQLNFPSPIRPFRYHANVGCSAYEVQLGRSYDGLYRHICSIYQLLYPSSCMNISLAAKYAFHPD